MQTSNDEDGNLEIVFEFEFVWALLKGPRERFCPGGCFHMFDMTWVGGQDPVRLCERELFLF